MARVFDEINTIEQPFKPRAIPFDDYFSPMEISEQDKAERIKLAEKFEVLLLFYFLLYLEDSTKDYTDLIYSRYVQIANDFLQMNVTSAYIDDYARQYVENLIDTTIRHDGDPWYTSGDRAKFNAEGESQATAEYRMKLRAVREGKKNKRWRAIIDSVTRKDHIHADGKVIGIFDTFKVGDSEFDFPRSLTYNPSPEQVANCRCWCEYF